MTPEEMAALYARTFPQGRAWAADEIRALIAVPGGFVVGAADGFALGRAVAGEAELITIAVDPARRRHGIGRRLLVAFAAEAAHRGATTAFLEVAADNAAALALYRANGWYETGRRRGYYARAGSAVDAVMMARTLDPAPEARTRP